MKKNTKATKATPAKTAPKKAIATKINDASSLSVTNLKHLVSATIKELKNQEKHAEYLGMYVDLLHESEDVMQNINRLTRDIHTLQAKISKLNL